MRSEKTITAELDADALPPLRTAGWGFHFDQLERLDKRAIAQVKLFTYRALAKGVNRDGVKFPDGHVIIGVEPTSIRGEFAVRAFFVEAPVGVSVLISASRPIGVFCFERMPREGFRDDDMRSKLREFGLEKAGRDN